MSKFEHISSAYGVLGAISTTIGDRLRDERQRLSLTQEDLAKAGRVHRRTQVNYENDQRKPNAAYFDLIAKAGVDPWYVLSGTRQVEFDFWNGAIGSLLLGVLEGLGYRGQQIQEILKDAEERWEHRREEDGGGWRPLLDSVFDGSPRIAELRSLSTELNSSVLEQVLRHLDEDARARQVELTPAKKALLITAVYRSAMALGRFDEKIAADLFRLSMPTE